MELVLRLSSVYSDDISVWFCPVSRKQSNESGRFPGFPGFRLPSHPPEADSGLIMPGTLLPLTGAELQLRVSPWFSHGSHLSR